MKKNPQWSLEQSLIICALLKGECHPRGARAQHDKGDNLLYIDLHLTF